MYCGETLTLVINSKGSYKIGEIDFSIYLYPDGFTCSENRIDSESCIIQEDGKVICSFPKDMTAMMTPGWYTIEFNDRTHGMIYVREHALEMKMSATANDIGNGE